MIYDTNRIISPVTVSTSTHQILTASPAPPLSLYQHLPIRYSRHHQPLPRHCINIYPSDTHGITSPSPVTVSTSTHQILTASPAPPPSLYQHLPIRYSRHHQPLPRHCISIYTSDTHCITSPSPVTVSTSTHQILSASSAPPASLYQHLPIRYSRHHQPPPPLTVSISTRQILTASPIPPPSLYQHLPIRYSLHHQPLPRHCINIYPLDTRCITRPFPCHCINIYPSDTHGVTSPSPVTVLATTHEILTAPPALPRHCINIYPSGTHCIISPPPPPVTLSTSTHWILAASPAHPPSLYQHSPIHSHSQTNQKTTKNIAVLAELIIYL